MVPLDNLFLVGPMGVGKTSVGRYLAKSLDRAFVDSDQEIEAKAGAPISLIFELEGEVGFRRRERLVLDRLTRRENIVLATGGGAILDRDTRSRLIHRGFVVYLRASADRLLRRIAGDRTRPLLQTADPRAVLEAIMVEREPLYRQVADLIIGADNLSSRQVASVVRRHVTAFRKD